MAKATDIKKKIKELFDELVRAEILGEVHIDDFKVGIFDRDYGHFPVAVITTPSIEAAVETNRDNIRTYMFEVVIIQKGENITETTEIEDLAEEILKKIDDDMLTGTLSKLRAGGADAGIEPSTSTPEAVVSRGKTYVVFSVFIRAKALYP